MRILVKSLKRLYDKGKITEEKIREMKMTDKITSEEMHYILDGE